MNKMKLAVGVDIGGTNTVFGLVDEKGNCLAQDSIKTSEYSLVNDFVTAIYKRVKVLISTQNNVEIIGMGIGAPNGNYYTGTIDFAPNLNAKSILS